MRRDSAAFILLVGALALAGAYKGVSLEVKRAALEKEQAEISRLRNYEKQLTLLEAQIKALRQRLPELEKVLPAEADLASLVRTLGDFARKSGVSLKGLSSSIVRRRPNEGFRPWTVSFEGGASDYGQIRKFLRFLEQHPRALYPKDLAVAYDGKKFRLRFEGMLLTYIRREK